MIVVGIDPGAHTGIVAMRLVHWPQVHDGLLVRAAKINMPVGAQRDEKFFNKVRAFFDDLPTMPSIVVIEQPVDGNAAWSRHREGRRQKRGTEFRLGASYGLCRAAVAAQYPYHVDVYEYAVKGYGKIPGWMKGTSHARVVGGVNGYLQAMGIDNSEWSDDQVMAMGLILRHAALSGGAASVTACMAGMPEIGNHKFDLTPLAGG